MPNHTGCRHEPQSQTGHLSTRDVTRTWSRTYPVLSSRLETIAVLTHDAPLDLRSLRSLLCDLQESLMPFTPASFGSASLGSSIQFRRTRHSCQVPCSPELLYDRSVAGAQKAEMFQCVALAWLLTASAWRKTVNCYSHSRYSICPDSSLQMQPLSAPSPFLQTFC